MAGGRIGKIDAKISIRANRALELRARGHTYRQIQDIIREEFGLEKYSYRLALYDCDRAIKMICVENTQTLHDMRNLELARYDDYLNKIYPKIENGDLSAVETALKISRERAKILGLYAPVEVKIQQIVESRINEELEFFFENLNDSEYIPAYVKERLYDIASEIEKRVKADTFGDYN